MRLELTQPPAVDLSAAAPNKAPQTMALGFRLRKHVGRVWHLYVLLLVTAFAGFIRFYYINYPAIWNDEAHVYRRITGSFQELLDIIQNDGFAPLHYELYWWLAHKLGGENLTAFWLRLVPSIAGTLMVPAMYFLARQLCTKRASLLTAAFTATSAYMMVYSHDAKMYAHFWLFCALNMGCMLWWTRTGLRIAWLAWVASGLAMLGLHAIGGFLLGLQLLILVTARYIHWKRFIVFLIGASIMASAPIVHYFGFNKWAEESEYGSWDAGGLGWLPPIVYNRSGPDLARMATSAFLFSWEWPASQYEPAQQSKSYRNSQYAFNAMLQGYDIEPRVYAGLMFAVTFTLMMAGVGALPWRWRRGTSGPAKSTETPRESWWRPALWLSVWAIVPLYAFYCPTVPRFSPPSDWINNVGDIFDQNWPRVILIVTAIAALCLIWRAIPLFLSIAVAAAMIELVAYTAISVTAPKTNSIPWQTPRLLFEFASDFVMQKEVLYYALLIGVPLVWYYCGKTVPQRIGRTIQLALIVATIYAFCYGIYVYFQSQPRGSYGPVWYPRYMAFVWPAFAIIVCAMIARLPSRLLRWPAIVVLLGVNLMQSAGRLAWGEPRIDLMAADVWTAQSDKSSKTRTYIPLSNAQTAHPSGGTLFNRVGHYYASIVSGNAMTPREFQSVDVSSRLELHPSAPETVSYDLRRNPKLAHIVIWDRLREYPADQSPDASFSRMLGADWRQTHENLYPVYYHWNWSRLYVLRRREYVKAGD